MTEIAIIRETSSLPFQFDRDGESLTGWVCTIFVKKFPQDTAVFSRVVAPTGRKWTGYLTSTEVGLLSVGLYYIIGQLVNATTLERQEIPIRFQVTSKWTT